MRALTLLTAAGQVAAIAATACVLCVAPVGPAAAQRNPTLTNIVPESEAIELQAKISAIDAKTRAITLVGANGSSVTVTAGPAVRLELLKTGDSVNVKYYRSVGFAVTMSQPGNSAPVSNDRITQVMARPAKTPGGDAIQLTTISATVVGLNVAAHTVDVVNPSGGGVYTIHVTDRERAAKLGSLKVGDTITAVISEALAVSVTPAAKSLF